MQDNYRRRRGMAVLVGATAASVLLATLQAMHRPGRWVIFRGPILTRTGTAWTRSAFHRLGRTSPTDRSGPGLSP